MTGLGELWWRNVLAGPDGELKEQDPGQSGAASVEKHPVEKYVVLPRLSDPRVVVDQACTAGLSDAVERMVSARTSNSVLRQIGESASSLATKKSPSWFVHSAAELGTLRQYLSAILGKEVTISVSVGPPRVNRKPVVRCYSGSKLVAVAKLGPDPHTSLMARNEANWLEKLEDVPIEGVKTPALLHAGAYGESDLIVMESLDLVDDVGVSLSEMPLATMATFYRSYFDPDNVLSDSSWWKMLNKRLGVLATPLAPTIERLVSDPDFDELDVSAWHGDFSPWNVGRTTDGSLAMWDWERATIGVPTGFDLLHLHYQYGTGLDGATMGLAEFGVRSGHHRLLKGLYLLELCARNAEAVATGTDAHHKVMRELHDLGW